MGADSRWGGELPEALYICSDHELSCGPPTMPALAVWTCGYLICSLLCPGKFPRRILSTQLWWLSHYAPFSVSSTPIFLSSVCWVCRLRALLSWRLRNALAPGHSWARSSGLTNEVTHLSSLRARGSLPDSLVPYRKELGGHEASWMATLGASSE